MRMSPLAAMTCALALCLLSGCQKMPGYPGPAPKAPQDQMNFSKLYKTNCAACHGDNGRNGTAIALNNPEYMALVDNATLKKWISQGDPKALMPAFAKSNGGTLTDKQIGAMIAAMRKNWSKPNAFGGTTPPPYVQPASGGDAVQGKKDYVTYCQSCHEGARESITSPSFLALISNQELRTIIIAGWPDLKQPDWRNDKPGHPLTDKQVTDIVAYLGSLRVANPGQPYPVAPVRTK